MPSTSEQGLLVVEDDLEIRETLCDLLTDEGYHVIPAENGLAALNYLRSASTLPALILLDISMPIMNGYEFRSEQVKDQRLAGIPTVMVSADGHIKDKASRVGIVDYLRKPIELDELLQVIQKHFPS